MSDPLLDAVADLPLALPDPGRAARVRARCHARLGRGARRRSRRPGSESADRRPLWEPFVAGLGLVYVGESVYLALRLYGLV
jgi:hypothetical protein